MLQNLYDNVKNLKLCVLPIITTNMFSNCCRRRLRFSGSNGKYSGLQLKPRPLWKVVPPKEKSFDLLRYAIILD